MTIKQACSLWINRDFSMIPNSLIVKAYQVAEYCIIAKCRLCNLGVDMVPKWF